MHFFCLLYVFFSEDFGVDELEDIVRNTTFPWMMSNVIDKFTGQPLADGLVTRIITGQGKKVRVPFRKDVLSRLSERVIQAMKN